MHEPTITAARSQSDGQPVPIKARLLSALIGGLREGRLTVELPSGERVVLSGRDHGGEAKVVLHRWRALRRFLLGGDTGIAEAYRDGDWSTADLRAFMQWGMANFGAAGTRGDGWMPARLAGRLRHAARANTRRASRRNIHAHYDLGNAFYAAWLDESMCYSSALYRAPGDSLADAQAAKLDRIVELLAARPGQSVLEIGCGWGALAKRLTADGGCHVTALTLSEEQFRFTREALAAAGLADKADVRMQDYRDLVGTFDRIASIEMLEAVGEKYWPDYFAKLRASLAPGGTVVLQAITIAESRFAAYRSRPDFIQKHIFPGGMLPTKTIIAEQARAAGLVVRHTESFGVSYARTLAAWREQFESSAPLLAQLGFGEPFRRLWSFYLAYCEAGFASQWLDVSLFALTHVDEAGTIA